MSYDPELFIEAVRDRPCLYDFRALDNKNRPMKDKAWMEIGYKFQISPAECIKKWTNLKDTNRRYLKEEKETRKSGSGASSKKPWYLAPAMGFMRDFLVDVRESVGNYSKTQYGTDEANEEPDSEGDDEEDEDDPSAYHHRHSSRPSVAEERSSCAKYREALSTTQPSTFTSYREALQSTSTSTSPSPPLFETEPTQSRTKRGRQGPRVRGGLGRQAHMNPMPTQDDGGCRSRNQGDGGRDEVTPVAPRRTPSHESSLPPGRRNPKKAEPKKNQVTEEDVLTALQTNPVAKVTSSDEYFCLSLVEPMGKLTTKNRSAFKRMIYEFLDEKEAYD